MCWRALQVFPEGDENDALSSHPSSAGENKNEEPAWEANWCRCPRGCHCAGEGDCCYCERCYHEGTWCKCDCRGCRAHDLAGEAEAPPPPDLPTPPPLAFSSPSPGSHPPPPPTPPLPWVQWRRAWSRRGDLQSLHKAAGWRADWREVWDLHVWMAVRNVFRAWRTEAAWRADWGEVGDLHVWTAVRNVFWAEGEAELGSRGRANLERQPSELLVEESSYDLVD